MRLFACPAFLVSAHPLSRSHTHTLAHVHDSQVTLYTFGEPRVGNKDFAEYATARLEDSIRSVGAWLRNAGVTGSGGWTKRGGWLYLPGVDVPLTAGGDAGDCVFIMRRTRRPPRTIQGYPRGGSGSAPSPSGALCLVAFALADC